MFFILSILSQLEEKLHFYCLSNFPSLPLFVLLSALPLSISLPGMREKDSEITSVAELGEFAAEQSRARQSRW